MSECALCLGSRREPPLVLGVPGPWSLDGSPATSSTLRLGVERRPPPFLVKLLSGKRDQGDRDCVRGRDLITVKQYSL